MKTTLLIMAAGIGSRFGTGIKQLEPVDDANHIIMDYSIHDAIEAGFNHVVKTPFIVINADDYYGKEGFNAVHDYLVNGGKSCMAGFVLKNTLSDNGGVTRGICKMDENGGRFFFGCKIGALNVTYLYMESRKHGKSRVFC